MFTRGKCYLKFFYDFQRLKEDANKLLRGSKGMLIRSITAGNRLRPGAAPGMPGAGFLLPPPVRGRKPEFRGRAAPGIPGFDSGGGNRNSKSIFMLKCM